MKPRFDFRLRLVLSLGRHVRITTYRRGFTRDAAEQVPLARSVDGNILGASEVWCQREEPLATSYICRRAM